MSIGKRDLRCSIHFPLLERYLPQIAFWSFNAFLPYVTGRNEISSVIYMRITSCRTVGCVCAINGSGWVDFGSGHGFKRVKSQCPEIRHRYLSWNHMMYLKFYCDFKIKKKKKKMLGRKINRKKKWSVLSFLIFINYSQVYLDKLIWNTCCDVNPKFNDFVNFYGVYQDPQYKYLNPWKVS